LKSHVIPVAADAVKQATDGTYSRAGSVAGLQSGVQPSGRMGVGEVDLEIDRFDRSSRSIFLPGSIVLLDSTDFKV